MIKSHSLFFFFNKILVIICVSGIIGFALGFTKWFNYNGVTLANLPVFPNILDSIFLIFSASYLGIRLLKGVKNEKQ